MCEAKRNHYYTAECANCRKAQGCGYRNCSGFEPYEEVKPVFKQTKVGIVCQHGVDIQVNCPSCHTGFIFEIK